MEQLITFGLTNAVTATLMALAAAAIARFSRRPVLCYALWLVVLLRLLAPPIYAVDLALPDLGRTAAASNATTVAVSGGAVALADSRFSLDPLAVIAAIWIAGAMAMIGFAIAQSYQLRQILATSEPASHAVTSRVADLSRRLGLRRAPPTVQVLDRVPPMLWAFLGSVRLILPVELLTHLDASQTDTLLAHELSHLRRRDHWVRHLEFAALSLFWWNPVAWWAARRLRRAQELCCDQRVAELLPGHRRAYADTLVETARFLSGRQLPLGSPARAMADMSQMKGRIRMIMNDAQNRELSLISKLAAATILVAALALTPILTATPEKLEFTGEPISLTLEDADLTDVLTTFEKITDKEIVIEPGISGKVTTKLVGVPWDEALSGILEDQGLVWTLQDDRLIVRAGDGAWSALEEVKETASPAGARVKVDNTTVYKFVEGGDIEPPKALEKLPPKYPPEMRKAGTSGSVVAELVIDTEGIVRDVAIQESPAEEFSVAATEALEQWQFEPATKNGKPVAVKYIVTLMFRLK